MGFNFLKSISNFSPPLWHKPTRVFAVKTPFSTRAIKPCIQIVFNIFIGGEKLRTIIFEAESHIVKAADFN